MKHILCAMKFTNERIVRQIFEFGRANDWLTEYCGNRVPRNWTGDGVITDFCQLEELRRIRNFEKTWIVSRDLPSGKNIRTVACDTRLLAKMTADYFESKGFRQLALAGPRLWPGGAAEYPHDPNVALHTEWTRRGLPVECCWWNASLKPGEVEDYEAALAALCLFFPKLPRPFAVFLNTPGELGKIYRVLGEQGIRVPEDAVILCNTDNVLLTENARVPTSYIGGEHQDAGLRLSQTMQKLLDGEDLPQADIYAAPATIVSRRSTDALAVQHPGLAVAVNFFLRNYMNSIGVADAVEAAGVSRARLDRLFGAQFGKPPGVFLLELRLNHICDLLDSTDLPLREIAMRTGYGSAMALTLAFKRAKGMSPGRYRSSRRQNKFAKDI